MLRGPHRWADARYPQAHSYQLLIYTCNDCDSPSAANQEHLAEVSASKVRCNDGIQMSGKSSIILLPICRHSYTPYTRMSHISSHDDQDSDSDTEHTLSLQFRATAFRDRYRAYKAISAFDHWRHARRKSRWLAALTVRFRLQRALHTWRQCLQQPQPSEPPPHPSGPCSKHAPSLVKALHTWRRYARICRIARVADEQLLRASIRVAQLRGVIALQQHARAAQAARQQRTAQAKQRQAAAASIYRMACRGLQRQAWRAWVAAVLAAQQRAVMARTFRALQLWTRASRCHPRAWTTAQRFAARSQQTRAVAAWYAMTQARLRAQHVRRRCIAYSQTQRLQRVLRLWRGWSYGHRNRAVHARLANQSASWLAQRHRTARTFRAWHTYTQTQVVVRRAEWHWAARTQAKAWAAWLWYATQAQRDRSAVVRAVRAARRAAAAPVFSAWATYTAQQARWRQRGVAAQHALLPYRARAALHAWRVVAASTQRQRCSQHAREMVLVALRIRAVVRCWRHTTQQRQHARALSARAAQHLAALHAEQALRTWIRHARARRTQRQACSALSVRVQQSRASACLRRWQRRAAHRAALRARSLAVAHHTRRCRARGAVRLWLAAARASRQWNHARKHAAQSRLQQAWRAWRLAHWMHEQPALVLPAPPSLLPALPDAWLSPAATPWASRPASSASLAEPQAENTAEELQTLLQLEAKWAMYTA